MHNMQTISFSFHEVAPYINWLYFFHAWGFPARLGSIAKVHGCDACRMNWLQAFSPDEQPKAREAMKLFDDAQCLIATLDSRYQCHARVAILPAYSENDDIVVLMEEETEKKKESFWSKENVIRIPLLRQQSPNEHGNCLCLSDFIKPFPQFTDEIDAADFSSAYSKVGIFACSVDHEMEEQYAEDEYLHLLHQTLADRLAEATAERMHEMVRKTIWGYAPNEHLTLDQLFSEEYQGKRPAVGYPSLPDQSLNFVLDKIIDFRTIGISLTENGAMRPHASTSGLMLAHPATCHFNIGTIADDQIEEYAKRRGMTVDAIRKFLR